MTARNPRLSLARADLAATWRFNRNKLAEAVYRTTPYRWLLRGPMPDRLLRVPDDPWPGDAARAEAMMAGTWSFEGRKVQVDLDHPFDATAPDDVWFDALHGFTWLRDFQALGGDLAEKPVRALVRAWIARHAEPGSPVWRAKPLARRLMAWACHARLVLDSSDLIFRSQVLRAMVRQAAHLARLAQGALEPNARLDAGLGLTLAGLSLPQSPQHLAQGLKLLAEEIVILVLPDGGPITRAPEDLIVLVADLAMVKAALVQARAEVPEILQHALDRATPMLRFFRHGDGGLALFHGTARLYDGWLDRVIALADAKGRPLGLAPHAGYARLAAKKSLILMDVGGLAPLTRGQGGHAGALAFEWSIGRHRVVTSVGGGRLWGDAWERSARTSAAHATLTLGEEGQAGLLAEPMARRLGARPWPPFPVLSPERREEAQGGLIEGAHDAYAARYGLRHTRRIFLDAEGLDVRGEDVVEPLPKTTWFSPKARDRVAFTLRFHLHPDVRVSLARDQRSALLGLSGGDGFVFRVTGAQLDLDETIYLADPSGPRRAQQLVLTGLTDKGEARIKWTFKRT